MKGGIVPNLNPSPNAHMAMDLASGANFGTGFHHDKGSDVTAISDFSRGVDVGLGRYSCGVSLGGGCPLQHSGKSGVGVLDPDESQLFWKFLGWSKVF